MRSNQAHVLYGHFGITYPTLTRGQGVYVFDDRGQKYLDAVGGVGVVNVGHGVEEVIQAITHQARLLSYNYCGTTDNLPRQQLAQKLQQWAPTGMGQTRTLFCSGGAEATEAALKLAYQYHWERGKPGKQKVIGRWQSYHGNTIGALSAGGRTSWRKMHSPYLLNFPHIPPPYCYRCAWNATYPSCGLQCAYELRRAIRQEGAENVAAFIAEPIVGTSLSAVVPPPEYYDIVRDICDAHDVLFISDEVLTGVGRTGERWGINHWKVAPDIITAAKGLASGYSPLAAVIVRDRVWEATAEGSQHVMHSYTFGGNPLSCAAGVAVLSYIEQHDLVSRARAMGDKLLTKLQASLGDMPCVGEVRGKGLYVGVELVADKEAKAPFPVEWDVAHRIQKEAFDRHLMILTGVTGLVDGIAGDHFELMPPYIVEDEHLDFIVDVLQQSISKVTQSLLRR
jgi:adenosylmethionine-8-amino-7-oxononanoate aminotransferase